MSKFREVYEKPAVKENVILILNSILAGFVLSVAAAGYIWCRVKLPNYGAFAGAFMFSFGLLVIILFELKLFTGMNANLPYTPAKKWWTLAVCFLFNSVGCWLGAMVFKGTTMSGILVETANEIIAAKTAASWSQMFLSAIFCGLCMTIGVLGCRAAKAKHFSATFFVVLPIMMFVFCGFEHSVANMIYMFLMDTAWTGDVWLLIIMAILGNIVGGVIIPAAKLLEGKRYLPAPVAAHIPETAPSNVAEAKQQDK